jgi:GGDEF domain-containing protein
MRRRVQAFEAHLKRLLKSLETEGTLDPATGLFARQAFWSDLARAVTTAEGNSGCQTVARFAFEETDTASISIRRGCSAG